MLAESTQVSIECTISGERPFTYIVHLVTVFIVLIEAVAFTFMAHYV